MLWGAIGLAALMVGLLIATSSAFGPGHQPGAIELAAQVAVIMGAFALVAVRITGKR